jgi:hypothetical protein
VDSNGFVLGAGSAQSRKTDVGGKRVTVSLKPDSTLD